MHPSAPVFKLPTKHRYSPFLDLLADAVFHHRLADSAACTYEENRHARSAILSAALVIECLANCLISDLKLHDNEFKVIDKLTPLDKIARFFKIKSIPSFDKGILVTQRCRELLEIRNSIVHSKIFNASGVMNHPQETETEWLLPFTIDLELWPKLGIPKAMFAWGIDSSRSAISASCEFISYVLHKLQNSNANQIAMFATYAQIDGKVSLIIPMPEGMIEDLKLSETFGIRWAGLDLSSTFSSAKIISSPR